MKTYFHLADFGAAFSTRAKGEDIGSRMCKILADLKSKDTFVIDFSGVEAISYSFMDELLRTVMSTALQEQGAEKSVVITDWSEDLFPVLDRSLVRRQYTLSLSTGEGNHRESRLRRSVTSS